MKKILIIGAGDFQLPLVQKAAEKYEVCLAAPSIDERFEKHIKSKCLCDVRDYDTILEYANSEGVDGVITDQTDIPVRTVAYVAEKLNLSGIGLECAKLFTDKSLMRSKLEECSIPVLPYLTTDDIEEAKAFFNNLNSAVIVKPLDTQGSRGVIKAENEAELEAAFDISKSFSTNGKAVVEKYASGPELVIEGITVDGEMMAQICGDTIYFNNKSTFSAKKRIFPSLLSKGIVDKTLKLNKKIVKAFGLNNGITHGEYIIDGDEVYLIEIAARGGGVYISSDLISDQLGIDVESFLLSIAMGEKPRLDIKTPDRVSGYRAFYLPKGTVKEIVGRDEVKSFDFIRHNQLDNIKPGMELGENTNKTSRFAMIISAPDYDKWREYEKKVIDTLHVLVEYDGKIRDIIWE